MLLRYHFVNKAIWLVVFYVKNLAFSINFRGGTIRADYSCHHIFVVVLEIALLVFMVVNVDVGRVNAEARVGMIPADNLQISSQDLLVAFHG